MPDYVVKFTLPGVEKPACVRLVRAKNQAQALRHVTNDMVTLDVATTEDVMSVAAAGGALETAAEE